MRASSTAAFYAAAAADRIAKGQRAAQDARHTRTTTARAPQGLGTDLHEEMEEYGLPQP
jgi:hypothetical protein